ncbi:hypothetical protein Bbelb_023890 [Branchiostoma belcheri]|nr:hypothetical protein Bbelb_023890 [Branchiostoma belcheri]
MTVRKALGFTGNVKMWGKRHVKQPLSYPPPKGLSRTCPHRNAHHTVPARNQEQGDTTVSQNGNCNSLLLSGNHHPLLSKVQLSTNKFGTGPSPDDFDSSDRDSITTS